MRISDWSSDVCSSDLIFQHLSGSVKPERDFNARKSVREKWWIYGEARNTFRPALAGLSNQIVTPLTAKHRIFTSLPVGVRADSTCVCIALEGGFALGILSSRSEERRVGKECVRTCRSRWWA